jgi:predicted PurR-regulated permease PerM
MLKQYPFPVRFVFIMLAIVLFFYVLVAAKLFLYPVALAILFAYLLYPISYYLERHRFPRILAILICLILFFSIITGALLVIYKRLGVFMNDLPNFRIQALNNIDILESKIGEIFGLSNLSLVELIRSRVAQMFDQGSDFLNRAFTATTGTFFRMAVLPVFIFMLLFYRTKFAHFILKLVKPEKRLLTIRILRELSKVTSRYMDGVFTVVFTLCFLNSAGFILIDLKYPIVFGVIAAFFSFIPFFGTIIGYTFPFIFALLTGDSPQLPLHVLLVFLVVQFTEHNILSPNIIGSYVQLNPFIIILGVIAGGMVWGLPGMFIVVPVIAAFRIVFVNVDSLKPYGYLLSTGGTRKHAITAENIKKFINRFRSK